MKRLMGKTEVEDALERLNVLTQEEYLMTVARTLIQELTHHVDNNVMEIRELTYRVDDNVMEIQELTHEVHADVEEINERTRSIDDNVKVTKDGALQFLYKHTDHSLLYVKSNG